VQENIIDSLKYDKNGLIPAVIQDYKDNAVLMVGYMSKETVEMTLKTGKATFFSRSRQKIWVKGEQSGNIQKVKEAYMDCDKDCLLIKVEQIGGAACHTGYRTCFFQKIEDKKTIKIIGKKIFDPKKVYK